MGNPSCYQFINGQPIMLPVYKQATHHATSLQGFLLFIRSKHRLLGERNEEALPDCINIEKTATEKSCSCSMSMQTVSTTQADGWLTRTEVLTVLFQWLCYVADYDWSVNSSIKELQLGTVGFRTMTRVHDFAKITQNTGKTQSHTVSQ